MMMYVRAEREGDWRLHMEGVMCMVPYFFEAGHVNHRLYYLRDLEFFMEGKLIVHHLAGICTSSDI